MKQYKYTLLKQDGTTKDLGISKQKSFKEFYNILDCHTIELIPNAYVIGNKRANYYGDEEGRFNSNNHTNPHFKIITDIFGQDCDVVGDIIKEEVYHGEKQELTRSITSLYTDGTLAEGKDIYIHFAYYNKDNKFSGKSEKAILTHEEFYQAIKPFMIQKDTLDKQV